MHILYTMANNTYSEYFTRFAEMAKKTPNVKVTFVNLYPTKPLMIDDMKEYGWECIWVPFDSTKRKRSMIIASWKLYFLFKKIKPDIIHTFLFDDSLPGLLAARLAGFKHRVITKCDTGFHHRYKPIMVNFDKFNNWNATKIITLTQENNDLVKEIEKPKLNKLRTIYSGLDYKGVTTCSQEDIQTVTEKFELNNYSHLIIKVARFIEWKGHEKLINAAPFIIEKFPKALILHIGYGPEKEKLEKLIQKLKLEKNVKLSDFIPRPLLNAIYKKAHVLVHLASYEPYGGVIIEAMMNSIPLVATKSGIAKECIKHGENGYTVNDNYEIIANQINYILSNNVKEIAENGKRTALESYTKEKNWMDHLDMYKSLLSL